MLGLYAGFALQSVFELLFSILINTGLSKDFEMFPASLYVLLEFSFNVAILLKFWKSSKLEIREQITNEPLAELEDFTRSDEENNEFEITFENPNELHNSEKDDIDSL